MLARDDDRRRLRLVDREDGRSRGRACPRRSSARSSGVAPSGRGRLIPAPMPAARKPRAVVTPPAITSTCSTAGLSGSCVGPSMRPGNVFMIASARLICLLHVGERRIEPAERLVGFGLGDDERRQQADDGVGRPVDDDAMARARPARRRVASCDSSSPQISPTPRTSLTKACFAATSRRRSSKNRPTRRMLSISPPSVSSPRKQRAARHASRFPP